MKKTRRGWNSTVRPGRPPQRKTRPKRKGKPRFKGRKDEAFREWVGGLPCCVKDGYCCGVVEGHHVKTRGAGGGDRSNLAPLCRHHHLTLHVIGRNTFSNHYGVDLRATAQHLLDRYLRETGEAA